MKHLEAMKKRREFSLRCIPKYRSVHNRTLPPPKNTKYLLSDASFVASLTISQAHSYFQQITRELLSCHRRDIYHGDLKPENILVDTERNTLKIWSCGIILYYLLTNGKLPNGSDFPEYMDDIAKHLVLRLLDTDPKQRFTLDDVTDQGLETSEEKFQRTQH